MKQKKTPTAVNKAFLSKALIGLCIACFAVAIVCVCCIGFSRGTDGKSAYQIAVENGFDGTEKDWIASLVGNNGADGKDGKDGLDGKNGSDGKDGRSIESVSLSEDGLSILITYSDQTTENVAIPTKECEHNFYKIPLESATCVKEGANLVVCEKGDLFYIERVAIDSDSHDYKPTTVLQTCEKDGYISYTCSICGDSYIEEASEKNGLLAKGHSGKEKAKLVITVEPDKNMCVDGYQKRLVCSDCMEYEYESEFINGGGHTVTDDWTVTVEPTASDVGKLCGICPVCGEYATVEIPASDENTNTDTPQNPNLFPGHWWDYKKENN